ncbi:MAG: sensor histidine kinase, partial [Acidimicrobiales bacterium]
LGVDVADHPIVVSGDPDRLAQVAANLLENALKFASSRVAVSAAVDGATAVLAVEDDGPGIAAEDLPHVFERLYVARARPRRKEMGSGLGLALVRELVAAMGGSVVAESSPLGGALLVVRLPLSVG